MDFSQKKYVLSLMRSPFWAILPDQLPLIANMLVSGIFPEWEAARPSTIGKGASKVAIIPIQGALSKDGPSWFGSNYDTISNAAETAAADASVKRVVLLVDSPGGNSTGLPEAAASITALAKVKPVTAMVEGMAASAAYWLASQANDVLLTPSGEVGSVGVRMMHVDISQALENDGIKVTELSAGQYKTEWSPFHPLTDEAKEDMQGRLSDLHNEFVGAVAAGRGARASQDMRDNNFGEGRMFMGPKALTHGLVDQLISSRAFQKSIIPVPDPEDEVPQHGLPRRARLELEKTKF